jgi:hypothetical protein
LDRLIDSKGDIIGVANETSVYWTPIR